jgi:hypothetical protein
LPAKKAPRGVTGAESDLKSKALWKAEIPITAGEGGSISPISSAPQESSEDLIEWARRKFAQRLGVPIEKVSVEFKVSS